MRARTVRHRTGEGGPTDKVLLPIFRARHVHKSQKSEQSVEDKDSDAQGQAVKHRRDSGVCYRRYTYLFDSPSMLENTDNPRTTEVMSTKAEPPDGNQRPNIPAHALPPQTWRGRQNGGASLLKTRLAAWDRPHHSLCWNHHNVAMASFPHTEVLDQHVRSFKWAKSQASWHTPVTPVLRRWRRRITNWRVWLHSFSRG